MKVLIDTCVVMDFFQKREPFAEAAMNIFQKAAAEKFSGCITAKSATDIYYLLHRCTHSDKNARMILNKLFSIIGLLDSTADDIFRAISSDVSDFEDAVMTETAHRSGMDCIVTRNTKDYKNSQITVYTPEQLLELLND